LAKLAKISIHKRFDKKVVCHPKPLSCCQYVKKPLWETLKEFLWLIVFAKPSEKWELMVKASSSHPRKLAKVLTIEKAFAKNPLVTLV
jgi:hypothetical protein